MPRSVDTEGVQHLVERGAQLVEVLPREEYETEHLPGARHLPLTEIDATTVGALDRARPIVVYCYDYQ